MTTEEEEGKQAPAFSVGNVVRYIGKERPELRGSLFKVAALPARPEKKMRLLGELAKKPVWVHAEEVELVVESCGLDPAGVTESTLTPEELSRLQRKPAPKQDSAKVTLPPPERGPEIEPSDGKLKWAKPKEKSAEPKEKFENPKEEPWHGRLVVWIVTVGGAVTRVYMSYEKALAAGGLMDDALRIAGSNVRAEVSEWDVLV